MPMTIEEVCDREAIRVLMQRYNIGGDRMKMAELANVFAPDGALEFSGLRFVGPQDILDAFTKPRALKPGEKPRERNPDHTFSRHHLGTSLIDFDDPARTTATGRTYFVVFTDCGHDHNGVYVDKFVKIDGDWFFQHRIVRVDWQSATSMNPPFPIRGKPVAQ